jgi:hypothetical protein
VESVKTIILKLCSAAVVLLALLIVLVGRSRSWLYGAERR